MANRAAQFAPFAALTGHDEAINETARQTSSFAELSDDEQSRLSRRIAYALELRDEKPPVVFKVFQPDGRKSGGCYVTVLGIIKSLDEYSRTVILQDGAVIPFDFIAGIDGRIFNEIDI